MNENIATNLKELVRSNISVLDWWESNKASYKDLIDKLESLGYEANLSSTGLDISGTGGKDKLVGAFRAFRAAGFNATSRPDAKTTYFSSFFYHDELNKIWFSFSSDVCKRVQIGTEFKEVPVYEVQCGESMAVDEEMDNG